MFFTLAVRSDVFLFTQSITWRSSGGISAPISLTLRIIRSCIRVTMSSLLAVLGQLPVVGLVLLCQQGVLLGLLCFLVHLLHHLGDLIHHHGFTP